MIDAPPDVGTSYRAAIGQKRFYVRYVQAKNWASKEVELVKEKARIQTNFFRLSSKISTC